VTSTAALLFVLLAAQAPRAEIAVYEVEGELQVDALGSGLDPLEFLRSLATESGRQLEGAEVLIGRTRLDVNLSERPLHSVLEYVGYATRTRIDLLGHKITITPERSLADVEDCRIDAEAAWVSLVRDFPDDEVARIARVELGALQEVDGHEDAALTHYDAAVRDGRDSLATERALLAAGKLLVRRGEWNEAMRRFSRLAASTQDESMQIEARLAISHALAEQGRGTEALALVDVVDLSYPARDAKDLAARCLARARGHLTAGSPASALRELDKRAASDPRLGSLVVDLVLRARALEELGSPLEAARAWLACSSAPAPADRADALYSAARLSAAGGDDIAVLFVERLARGGPRAAELARLAAAARARLGLDEAAGDLSGIERRWDSRAGLTPRELVALAAELVTATARAHGADAAAPVARRALDEVPNSDARPIRSALALAYESEGAWTEAARTWGGTSP